MSKRDDHQPPSPEPKRNTAYDGHQAQKEGKGPAGKETSEHEDAKPDEGTRPDRLTTENDDGQG